MKLSKKIAPVILFCLILTCFIPALAKADTIFTAALSGLNEVPANSFPGIGFITLDFSGTNLFVIETWRHTRRQRYSPCDDAALVVQTRF
jgi:hypothetical protein